MQMLVGVDVIECETGRVKCLELGADFLRQLAADLGQEKEAYARAGHVADRM